ncbi:MAG: hypothetical protein M1822_009002 [Bathelium mastoideum]|nr:MAG: hypothetical protein M1822_009002 [Bathelium mastoideum]
MTFSLSLITALLGFILIETSAAQVTTTIPNTLTAQNATAACSVSGDLANPQYPFQIGGDGPEPTLIGNATNVFISITSSLPSITKHKSTTAPPSPTPSCNLQDADPGLGITAPGCICQGSSTWPTLSTTSGAEVTMMCAYTASPSGSSSTVDITEAPASPTTNSAACLVCTPLPNYEGECTSMSSCTPQSAFATATVNSSPVHYGTITSDVLFTGMSTAVASACKSLTTGTTTTSGKSVQTVACDGKNDYTISRKVPHVVAGILDKSGSLTVNVASYAQTGDQLNALFPVLAGVLEKAVNSSQQSCYKMKYDFHSMQVCNGPSVAVASYWAPGWQSRVVNNQNPSPDAQMIASIKFHKDALGEFFCELAVAVAGDLLAEFAPELATLEIAAAKQIEAACER